MARVDWQAAVPVYEEMVGVLIGHLHPTSQKIDGSGGDGGRDVIVPTDAGTVIYELKSFTGRMDQSRRKQVKRSLTKASEQKPVEWNLVVPIDPTPGELTWFKGLTKNLPFKTAWLGRSWLDREMAERPSIPRYFMQGAADEVVRILAEIREEKSQLTSAPQAAERLGALAQRANELDPYYRFELIADGERTSIRLIPRYVGAEQDKPITLSMTLKFPDTEEGRRANAAFEEYMSVGRPTTIAPEYVENLHIEAPAGLGGDYEGASIEALPVDLSSMEPLPLQLACLDPQDAELATLDIPMSYVSRGNDGAVLRGTDRSGSITIDMTLRQSTNNVTMTLVNRRPATFLPHDLLPALVLLAEFIEPNRMEVRVGEAAVGSMAAGKEPWVSTGARDFIRDVALIQLESGRIVPLSFTTGSSEDRIVLNAQDLGQAELGGMLLRGEPVEVEWSEMSFRMHDDLPDEERDRAQSSSNRFRVQNAQPFDVTIAGERYRLGRGQTMALASAKIANQPADDDGYLRLVPDASNKAMLSLIR